MANTPHNHGILISALETVLRTQFTLSPQRFYLWKQRGVPYSHRSEVARLAGIHGVQVPEGFLSVPPPRVASQRKAA